MLGLLPWSLWLLRGTLPSSGAAPVSTVCSGVVGFFLKLAARAASRCEMSSLSINDEPLWLRSMESRHAAL